MRKLIVIVVLAAVVAVGLYFVFGRDGAGGPGVADGSVDADAPLAFVPADTPYVVASLEPLPKASIDAWLQQSEPALRMWLSQLDLAATRMQTDAADEPATKWVRALNTEFKDKTVAQAIAAMGLDLQARSAFYGIGLVPVARITLADPTAFGAFVARLEASAGEKLATAAIDGVNYWQFADPQNKLRGIVALHGKHLVATVAPVGDDSALRTLLGLDRPAKSMSDGGELAAINKKYGYLPYATGYIDSTRLVNVFTAAPTPLETAFLAALEIEKPTVDAVCQAEYAALATVAPRLVLGYTTLEPKVSNAVTRIELRSDVAQDLMKLRAPMPGLDAGSNAMINFGFSLKLAELPPLVNKWAGQVSKAPWKCESLAGMNQAFADSSAQAANPAVFAAAPVFYGLHAILTRFEMDSLDAAPDFSGKLLIGSPNPAALIGMAQSFAPQLAQLQLKPNGEVQPLPALEGMPPDVPAHAAMTDKLLGLAVGAGEEATLKDAMTIDPARQPLLVIGYSGAAFTQFAKQMESTMLAVEQDEAKRAEAEQSMKMMRDMYALIRRIEVRVEFGENGIEFHQSATMN
jgi:hypothetical protein